MKVFKACLKVVKSKISVLMLYFIIFIAFSVAMTTLSKEQYTTDFTALEPNFTIINRDPSSSLGNDLTEFLELHGTNVALEDSKEVLQDATFYHASDYIIIIPEGFSARVGDTPALQTITTPNSAKGFYMDQLTNQYLNTKRQYQLAVPELTGKPLHKTILEDLSKEVTVEKKSYSESQPVEQTVRTYIQMYAYIILILVMFTISTIMQVFRRPDLHMRNLCTPIKLRSMNAQLILCGGLISLLAWLLLMVTGWIIYGSSLSQIDLRIILLLLLNSVCYLLIAIGLGFLVGSFVRSSSSQNSVANLLSLGSCFLGGIFVPLNMLGEGLRTVSQFIPAYWYATALNRICSLTEFTGETLIPIWQAFLIQIGFAVALCAVALVISKVRQQSTKGFAMIETEIET